MFGLSVSELVVIALACLPIILLIGVVIKKMGFSDSAAQLEHPGIVPIFEIGQHHNQHYFSMAFIEGDSLQERVRQGPMEPREAATISGKITAAIAFAHEKRVIHRR